jgi:cytoskeletal protein RodZ
MKSVGQILKQERKKQKKSILQIHRETKIPEQNIIALENNNFASLPPATFVKGFIQIYAKNLGLDEKKLIAVFRRDWRKKEKTKIVPEELKDSLTRQKFVWSPKMTLILATSFFLTIFIAYLGFQIKNFFSPPKLTIEKPQENEQIRGKTIEVKGETDKGASVYLNDELINPDEKGSFTYELKVFPGENTITIKAVDRREKQTTIERQITVIDKEN